MALGLHNLKRQYMSTKSQQELSKIYTHDAKIF